MTDDKTDGLAAGLPEYFPNSPESPNYDLLKPVGEQIAEIDAEIEDVDHATSVQDAMAPSLTVSDSHTVHDEETEYYKSVTVKNGATLTVNGELVAEEVTANGTIEGDGRARLSSEFLLERLAEHGKMVDLPPREGESISHYRSRLLAEYASVSSKGTPDDVIEAAANILDSDIEDIGYQLPTNATNGNINAALPARALDDADLSPSQVVTILDRIAAAGVSLAGFRLGTFTYITPTAYNNNNHDATKGYDGLDSNGDPKDNGGTYAGVI